MNAISIAELHAALRGDFHTFMLRAFLELNPRARLLPNWHMLCAKLQAVREGRIKRLIVCIPPRAEIAKGAEEPRPGKTTVV